MEWLKVLSHSWLDPVGVSVITHRLAEPHVTSRRGSTTDVECR